MPGSYPNRAAPYDHSPGSETQSPQQAARERGLPQGIDAFTGRIRGCAD